jgi:hypothetical protein
MSGVVDDLELKRKKFDKICLGFEKIRSFYKENLKCLIYGH